MRLLVGVSVIVALLGRFPEIAEAQAAAASAVGTVRDATSDSALSSVIIDAALQHAVSDSLGRWTLHALPAGATRVRFRRVGFIVFDTTIVLPSAGETRLDVRLRPAPGTRALLEAGKANVAAGRIDSSALGLLHRSPSDSSLTFSAFGARFLRALASRSARDSNTVLSPTSAAFALSLPLLGAGGATANEIATALGVAGMDRATLRRRTASAMVAGTGRSDVQLEIANAVWVDTSARLNPRFVDAVAPYHTLVRSTALAGPGVVRQVNAWSDSVTHGKISEMLKQPLPDSARLFIANAVYFKGKWLDAFDKTKTRRRDFRLETGRRVPIEGMERTGYVGYRRGERYQMIRLPYRGGRFAMYVVLPDSGTAAATIEQEFAAQGMPESLTQKDFRDVHLVLPRLHAVLSLDLIPALWSLGIHRAFDCNLADLSGIAIEHAGGIASQLCIAKATQSVYLDVDEEGTEAAAVTGLTAVTIVSLPPPPIEFIVDRPFLFLLRDEQTGADLFGGTIRRP